MPPAPTATGILIAYGVLTRLTNWWDGTDPGVLYGHPVDPDLRKQAGAH